MIKADLHISALIAGLLISLSVIAKPASREPFIVRQQDGSQLEVCLHGDERFHYLTDSQGRWLRWEDDRLVSIPQLNHAELQNRRLQSKYNMAQESQVDNGAYLAPRGLVLLVNFSDLAFRSENTQAAFDSLMNVPNYTYNGVSGSVRDYFIDQSHGQYSPQFDVYGPVTVNHTMAYYGANDYNDNDRRPEELISDACKAAKQLFDIDFSQYDNDDDGYVDFVFVFYAGYGEADGASKNTIWQHMFRLKTYGGINCVIDGKTIDLYACGSELAYQNRLIVDNPRDGISTCCHEFSHVCGLPDMYNTSDKPTVFTLGKWDLMDYGTSNNHGWTPPAYSAYERFYCGWITPTLLNSACDVELPDLKTSGAACIMTATGMHNLDGVAPNPDTFYMLENRQQTGWDEYIPGHGLLINQIQYSAQQWEKNMVNTNSTQRVSLQVADSQRSQDGDAGDSFPGSEQITTYTGLDSFPVTNITETDSIIRFQFMEGGHDILLNTPQTNEQQIGITPISTGIKIINLDEVTLISIYDSNGQLLIRRPITPQDNIIQLSQHGIYVVKIGQASKTIIF